MGYDMNAFAEVRQRDGHWVCPGFTLDIPRNYILFDALTDIWGVYPGKSLSTKRGLPDDVSESVKLYRQYWGLDFYHESWLSYEELSECDLLVKDVGVWRELHKETQRTREARDIFYEEIYCPLSLLARATKPWLVRMVFFLNY